EDVLAEQAQDHALAGLADLAFVANDEAAREIQQHVIVVMLVPRRVPDDRHVWPRHQEGLLVAPQNRKIVAELDQHVAILLTRQTDWTVFGGARLPKDGVSVSHQITPCTVNYQRVSTTVASLFRRLVRKATVASRWPADIYASGTSITA